MPRMLVVEPHGDVRLVADAAYPEIAAAVGGYIGAIPVADGVVVMYGNEEGRLVGLPGNPIADMFWADVFPVEFRVPGDHLVGPIVVFGPDDGEGNETDVPDWVLDRFGIEVT